VEKLATVADLLKARSGVYHPALYESPEMAFAHPARGAHWLNPTVTRVLVELRERSALRSRPQNQPPGQV